MIHNLFRLQHYCVCLKQVIVRPFGGVNGIQQVLELFSGGEAGGSSSNNNTRIGVYLAAAGSADRNMPRVSAAVEVKLCAVSSRRSDTTQMRAEKCGIRTHTNVPEMLAKEKLLHLAVSAEHITAA